MRKLLFRFGVVATAVVAAVLGVGQPAVAAPTLEVSVHAARLLNGGAGVVLNGMYSCGPFSPDSDGVVDLTVSQESAVGYGYLYLTQCDGSPHSWVAPVDRTGGQFTQDRAEVSGSGYACDRGPGGGCAFGSFGPTTLRIR